MDFLALVIIQYSDSKVIMTTSPIANVVINLLKNAFSSKIEIIPKKPFDITTDLSEPLKGTMANILADGITDSALREYLQGIINGNDGGDGGHGGGRVEGAH